MEEKTINALIYTKQEMLDRGCRVLSSGDIIKPDAFGSIAIGRNGNSYMLPILGNIVPLIPNYPDANTYGWKSDSGLTWQVSQWAIKEIIPDKPLIGTQL